MRKFIVTALFFLVMLQAGTVPTGWKTVKDSKSACQIAVPANWSPGAENTGSAVFDDASVAIAVVTSQPGQTFRPVSDSFLKLMRVPKEKVFENSATRSFYQDRTSGGPDEPDSFSVMLPGNGGTCSARVVFHSPVTEETARKIALSLAPVE